jgi:hypothetical protein
MHGQQKIEYVRGNIDRVPGIFYNEVLCQVLWQYYVYELLLLLLLLLLEVNEDDILNFELSMIFHLSR